jgi:UDP-N-acetylglucosamine 2-epimerase (non-hydrolysing)
MRKVLLVFGTRPEAIKMAPLALKLKKSDYLQVKICITAQHREMLDQVMTSFDLKADYDLDLMRTGQNLNSITADVVVELKPILHDFKPDLVLVHGDTTTTMVSSLAAYYEQIPVAHVEAGLRTNNIYSPWPEEINRQLTGRIASYHFAPTEEAAMNLMKEGVDRNKIYVTGNTVIDALLLKVEKIRNNLVLKNGCHQAVFKSGYDLNVDKKFILITGHRRENFGKGFENICMALKELAKRNPNIDFVYPVHLNPNVKKPVEQLLTGVSNIHLIAPQDYEPFIYLMDNCLLIMSDSGGIQEEAPSLGKPVLVMRDTTERPEAVRAGTVKLVGTELKALVKETQQLIDDSKLYEKMSRAHNPYGDGTASKRILDIILAKRKEVANV